MIRRILGWDCYCIYNGGWLAFTWLRWHWNEWPWNCRGYRLRVLWWKAQCKRGCP